MAMTKEERRQYKENYKNALLKLVEEDPNNSFLQGLREYRRRLNAKQDDAFKTVEEADNYLSDLQSKDPWWLSFTAGERRRRLQEIDPEKAADFNDGVNSARLAIEASARAYSVTLDEQRLNDLARQSYLEGWDENNIRAELRRLVDETLAADETNEGLTGSLGGYAAELSGWSTRNGFEIDQATADRMLSSVAFGEMSMEQVKDSLRQQYMVGAFPAWAEQINAGMDIYDLAAPYRATAQKMLGRTEIQLNDPIMQQMMQYQDEGGSWKARPLWEAEKFIRNTEEWQYTDDAYDTYATVGARIGRMFGFG
jgi:hypothetical protein